MTLQAAFEEQLERYRRMTGEQRLAIALDLHELACDIARAGIRQQNAGADEIEVERLLRERRLAALDAPEELKNFCTAKSNRSKLESRAMPPAPARRKQPADDLRFWWGECPHEPK